MNVATFNTVCSWVNILQSLVTKKKKEYEKIHGSYWKLQVLQTLSLELPAVVCLLTAPCLLGDVGYCHAWKKAEENKCHIQSVSSLCHWLISPEGLLGKISSYQEGGDKIFDKWSVVVTRSMLFWILQKGKRMRDGVGGEKGVKRRSGCVWEKLWSEIPFLFHIPLCIPNPPFLCRSYSFQTVTKPRGFTSDSNPSFVGLLCVPQALLIASLWHFWCLKN